MNISDIICTLYQKLRLELLEFDLIEKNIMSLKLKRKSYILQNFAHAASKI